MGFGFFEATLLVSTCPYPISILFGRVKSEGVVWTVFFIMTEPSTLVAKGGEPLILKGEPSLPSFKIYYVASSSKRFVEW